MAGPMTLIIVAGVVVMFILGALLIRTSRREQPSEWHTVPCSQCGAVNPDHAKFCAQCGAPISG